MGQDFNTAVITVTPVPGYRKLVKEAIKEAFPGEYCSLVSGSQSDAILLIRTQLSTPRDLGVGTLDQLDAIALRPGTDHPIITAIATQIGIGRMLTDKPPKEWGFTHSVYLEAQDDPASLGLDALAGIGDPLFVASLIEDNTRFAVYSFDGGAWSSLFKLHNQLKTGGFRVTAARSCP